MAQYVNHIDPENVSCVFEPTGIWIDTDGDSKSSAEGNVLVETRTTTEDNKTVYEERTRVIRYGVVAEASLCPNSISSWYFHTQRHACEDSVINLER